MIRSLRSLIAVSILIAAVLVLAGGPVVHAQKSTPQPTPNPPPLEQKQPEPPTPTPTPEKSSSPTPTKLPSPPTPTPEPPTPTATDTPRPRPSNTPTPDVPTPTPTLTPTPVIAGRVFDDRDGDGVQDLGEPGIAAVPVTVDGMFVGTTNSNGWFVAPIARGKGLLAIVPPHGWQWDGDPLPVAGSETTLGNVVSFAMRREETEPAASAVAGKSTIIVIGVGILVALVFDGIATLVQASVARAGNRRAAKIGLAQLDAMREQLEQKVSVRLDEVVGRLGRFALEATGSRAGIDQVIDVVSRPHPAMTALGQDLARYVFTTAPRHSAGELLGDNPRLAQSYPIDASTSGLTAATELAAIWTLLAEERGTKPEELVLPRSTCWYLHIVPRPAPKKLKLRQGWWPWSRHSHRRTPSLMSGTAMREQGG